MKSIFLVIVFLGITSLTTIPSYADAAFQDARPLEGRVIYFSEDEDEAGRFDRSERGISRYAGLLSQFGATMNTLEWNTGVPEDADLLIIAAPTGALSADKVARLWLYLLDGGNVLLIADAVDYRDGLPDRQSRGLESDRAVFELLWPEFGIRTQDHVLVQETDDPTLAVPLTADEPPTDPAMLNMTLTTTSFNTNSEIMAGIEEPLFLEGARGLSLDATTPDLTTVPLAFVEGDFYGEADFDDYLDEGIATFDAEEDTPPGIFPIAIALENMQTGSRVALLGDIDLINNSGGFRSSPSYSSAFLFPQNIQFAAQLTTWLMDAEAPGLAFPEPEPTTEPTIAPTPTTVPTEEAAEGN